MTSLAYTGYGWKKVIGSNKRHSCHLYRSGNSKGLRSSVPGTRGKDQIYIFMIILQGIIMEPTCRVAGGMEWDNGDKAESNTICLQEAQTFQAKGEQTEAEAGMGGTEVEPEWVGVGQPGWMAEPPQASWWSQAEIHTVSRERLELREWLHPSCLDPSLSKAPASSSCFPSPIYTRVHVYTAPHTHVHTFLGLIHSVPGTSPLLLPTVSTSSLLSSSQGHSPIHSLIPSFLQSFTKHFPRFWCPVLASLNWTNHASLPSKGAPPSI